MGRKARRKGLIRRFLEDLWPLAKEGALDLERIRLEVSLDAEKIVVLLFEIVEEEGRFVVGCIIEEVGLLLVLELEDDE